MEIVYKEESYAVIGKCIEVHRELGHGFLEIVYKDALEILFRQGSVFYEREKEYPVFSEEFYCRISFSPTSLCLTKLFLKSNASLA